MPEGMPPEAGQEAPPKEDAGGGIAEGLAATGAQLQKFTEAVSQDPQVPDEVKAQFAAALEAFTGAAQGLSGGPSAGGSATPEQGGNPNAKPMGMGGGR